LTDVFRHFLWSPYVIGQTIYIFISLVFIFKKQSPSFVKCQPTLLETFPHVMALARIEACYTLIFLKCPKNKWGQNPQNLSDFRAKPQVTMRRYSAVLHTGFLEFCENFRTQEALDFQKSVDF